MAEKSFASPTQNSKNILQVMNKKCAEIGKCSYKVPIIVK